MPDFLIVIIGYTGFVFVYGLASIIANLLGLLSVLLALISLLKFIFNGHY